MYAKDSDYKNRIMRKCVSATFVLFILTISFAGVSERGFAAYNLVEGVESASSSFSSETVDIEGLTLAIMRMDSAYETPHGTIDPVLPSRGNILVIGNSLSLDLMSIVFDIKKESETDTVKSLAEYARSNMDVQYYRCWASPNAYYIRSGSAQEMLAFQGYYGKIDGGNCHSHASFHTTVLRMAGFSPEKVFNIWVMGGIPGTPTFWGHAITLVNADGMWYMIDSTLATPYIGTTEDDTLYTSYQVGYWCGIENDKYYVNFNQAEGLGGVPRSSNMPPSLLREVVHQVRPLLGHPQLGVPPHLTLEGYIAQADSVEQMVDIALPHSVLDSSSPEELALKNYEFINKTASEHPNSQYMKALCGMCVRDERFYPVYANAAKLGAWAQYYGDNLSRGDVLKSAESVFEFFGEFNNLSIVQKSEVTYGDFPLILKNGTSLDKAISAYGVMRNTNDSGDFVQPEKLWVLIDEYGEGYLAVKISENGWLYMDFCNKTITYDCPSSITYSFNEIGGSNEWFEKDKESDMTENASPLPMITIVFVLILIVASAVVYERKTKKISEFVRHRKK